MRRHGEAWKVSFSHKDDMSETHNEDIVVKLRRPISIRWDGTHYNNEYFDVNFSLFEERIM
jgi:hypothetical protein